jgi:hypothetical protein
MFKPCRKEATQTSKRAMFDKVVLVKASPAPEAAQVTTKSGKFVFSGLCMSKLRRKVATEASKQEMFGKVVKIKPASSAAQETTKGGKFALLGLCMLKLRSGAAQET